MLVVPAVRELLEAEIAFAVAALETPQADGSLPLKYSKEFTVPPSMVDIFPKEVGTIRVFGLQVNHPCSSEIGHIKIHHCRWHLFETAISRRKLLQTHTGNVH